MKHETKDNSLSASPAVEDLKNNSCPNCGQSFFSHNDDGSCVEDNSVEDLKLVKWFDDGFPPIDLRKQLTNILNVIKAYKDLKAENTKLAASNLEWQNCVNAIGARLDGEWDNKHLQRVGYLHASIHDDINAIIKFYADLILLPDPNK